MQICLPPLCLCAQPEPAKVWLKAGTQTVYAACSKNQTTKCKFFMELAPWTMQNIKRDEHRAKVCVSLELSFMPEAQQQQQQPANLNRPGNNSAAATAAAAAAAANNNAALPKGTSHQDRARAVMGWFWGLAGFEAVRGTLVQRYGAVVEAPCKEHTRACFWAKLEHYPAILADLQTAVAQPGNMSLVVQPIPGYALQVVQTTSQLDMFMNSAVLMDRASRAVAAAQRSGSDEAIRTALALQRRAQEQQHAVQQQHRNAGNHLPQQLRFDDPQNLFDGLMEYQREAVLYCLSRQGRVLLADEPGLGKTAQSLAMMYQYRQEWPLLIVCLPVLKFNWREECMRWLRLEPHQILVRQSNESKKPMAAVPAGVRVVIAPYTGLGILQRLPFRCVIIDESHCIKNMTAKRTKDAITICENAQRIVMLSGTPAKAKPVELLPQLIVLCWNRPDLGMPAQAWKGAGKEFQMRYCGAVRSARFGLTESGHTCLNELNLLCKVIMLRRKKAHVLHQLPPKTRETILLEAEGKKVQSAGMTALLDQAQKGKLNIFAKEDNNNNSNNNGAGDGGSSNNNNKSSGGGGGGSILAQRPPGFMQLYEETAQLKQKAVCEWVVQLLTDAAEEGGGDGGDGAGGKKKVGAAAAAAEADDDEIFGEQDELDDNLFAAPQRNNNNGNAAAATQQQQQNRALEAPIRRRKKYLFFAHHICMLDALENAIRGCRAIGPNDLIRIDGSTPSDRREALVNHFNHVDSCRAAVLSIMAAGTGLNLTAASTVVFAELDFTPSQLVQCEDRVHRMGQRYTCDIKYLLARGTLDDIIWPMLSKKLEVTNGALADAALVQEDRQLVDPKEREAAAMAARQMDDARVAHEKKVATKQMTLDKWIVDMRKKDPTAAAAAANNNNSNSTPQQRPLNMSFIEVLETGSNRPSTSLREQNQQLHQQSRGAGSNNNNRSVIDLDDDDAAGGGRRSAGTAHIGANKPQRLNIDDDDEYDDPYSMAAPVPQNQTIVSSSSSNGNNQPVVYGFARSPPNSNNTRYSPQRIADIGEALTPSRNSVVLLTEGFQSQLSSNARSALAPHNNNTNKSAASSAGGKGKTTMVQVLDNTQPFLDSQEVHHGHWQQQQRPTVSAGPAHFNAVSGNKGPTRFNPPAQSTQHAMQHSPTGSKPATPAPAAFVAGGAALSNTMGAPAVANPFSFVAATQQQQQQQQLATPTSAAPSSAPSTGTTTPAVAAPKPKRTLFKDAVAAGLVGGVGPAVAADTGASSNLPQRRDRE